MTLAEKVRTAVRQAPVVDLHTHLFPPQFGSLNRFGIDELLTYHYLVAETLRAEPKLSPERFFGMSQPDQADLVWETLFVARAPLSEAASGIVTVLSAFGLNPAAPDLREARAFYASRQPQLHLEDVLAKAGVSAVAMTNDPLDAAEAVYWRDAVEPDPRFYPVLRLDPIINQGVLGQNPKEVRRWLTAWRRQMKPKYLAVSLPDTFTYPDGSSLLTEAVLPMCEEHDLPLALMVGVRRAVNPRLGMAGDGMGNADIQSLERLAATHPSNRFLVTTLSQASVHPLCVAARKFSNLLPFGCWWFMNNPSLVEDVTRLRLEMLGPTFVPQHSDARILDQLIYKWAHARRAIASALTSRYEALEESGRAITQAEIDRDARALMGGIAAEWLR